MIITYLCFPIKEYIDIIYTLHLVTHGFCVFFTSIFIPDVVYCTLLPTNCLHQSVSMKI